MLEEQPHVLPRAQVPVPSHVHPAYASVNLMVTEWLLYVSITPEEEGAKAKSNPAASLHFYEKKTAFPEVLPGILLPHFMGQNEARGHSLPVARKTGKSTIFTGYIARTILGFCKTENSESSQTGSLSADMEGEG